MKDRGAMVLAREIGWVGNTFGPRIDTPILCAWTRLLAAVVRDHTLPGIHAYAHDVVRWAKEIVDASDEDMFATCERIGDEIEKKDSCDGWATDRAGAELERVCLAGTLGIADQATSRWPAEASSTVWAFAVGCGSANHNAVIAISKSAWQRHLFSQALALAR